MGSYCNHLTTKVSWGLFAVLSTIVVFISCEALLPTEMHRHHYKCCHKRKSLLQSTGVRETLYLSGVWTANDNGICRPQLPQEKLRVEYLAILNLAQARFASRQTSGGHKTKICVSHTCSQRGQHALHCTIRRRRVKLKSV